MKRLKRRACVGLCCVVVGVAVYGILIKDRTTGGVASDTIDSVSGKASSKLGPSGSLESGSQKVQHSQSMRDLHENEFGTTQGEPFARGFLFFDGQYLDVPYRVTRKGLGIFVNAKMVVPPVQWPIRERPSGEADPELPRQLTRNTSIYDEVFCDYIRKKVAYVQNKHGPKEEREIMEKVYRSLPFVKEASLDPKNANILHVKTYTGETDSLGLARPRRRRAVADAKAVLKSVEEQRVRLEQRLSAGSCCYLFSEGGGIILGKDKARRQLPRIVEILGSNEPTAVKFRDLQRAGMPFVNAESFSAVVKGFSPSRQLDERLREMAEGEQATSRP